ncbi:PRC-barrel domain-containing protein [Paraburkholderia rhizosphaerae]|uniref:PRC-barrel domain protein n=1 Tax=Paraburkholderia rhizosphaerae TaxID=480658 RepID=A0A4R8LAS1_9BURK|nr:PRC-barrel domain-containing protein [Paraburkholderia rhizosphaerae]TDY39070.1 PRC-barrel domain protein [Paraburkholderia rhizosphaerae]
MTTLNQPASSAGARVTGKGASTADGPGPNVMAAATLDGNKVLCADGDTAGKVKDIMLDVRTGRIAYVVMSSGGFLGIGDKLFAIPWSVLTLDTDRECFVLNVDSQRVKDAPGFDQDHWPSMADRGWATSVHDYYGSEPYWGAHTALQDPLADPLNEMGDALEGGRGELRR